MGISGLIPFVEKASSKVHLKNIRGCTVAVDTYCWLHKGVFTCAEKLARGEETDLYIQYCLKYVLMLLSYNIKPILVYDGRHLPAKALTEKRRRESRKLSKKLAADLLRDGQIEEARSYMRRCVDVTHDMALRLIRECRRLNVDCIVAPYEADSQLAWFNKISLAQYVITEDSDLLLFGASRVIFKLDLTGAGLLVEADKLYLAMGCSMERYTFDKFRRMCILSGCDYLDSLPGIGLVKACKFLLKTEEDDMRRALKKIPIYMKMRNLEVDEKYIEEFLKAEATFRHMYIYNPFERRMERLHELNEFETEECYTSNAGTLMEDSDQSFQLALGNLDPFTLRQLDTWHPCKDLQIIDKNLKSAQHKSIWQKNFEQSSNANTDTKGLLNHYNNSNSSAFVFKKVNFFERNINTETSIDEEQSKPIEADIFLMYQNEAKDIECDYRSHGTQKRKNSSPAKSHSCHNPFAKTDKNPNLPIINKNNSFLNTLNSMTGRTLNPTLNDTKNTASEKPEISIKSRFFAANIKEVKEQSQLAQIALENVTKDLSAEIEEIEGLTQRTQNQLQSLYQQIPPVSKSPAAASSEVRMGNMEEEEATDEIGTSLPTDIDKMYYKQEDNNVKEIVAISDDYDDANDDNKSSSRLSKKFELSKFPKQKAPRLGLSKPKKIVAAKGKNQNMCLEQNQKRLSMFGFQNRPKLK